jgi:hypothetical protein
MWKTMIDIWWKHVGSELWGLRLVKASNFLLIFGLCYGAHNQVWLGFLKELGQPVNNEQAEPAPALVHSPSWIYIKFITIWIWIDHRTILGDNFSQDNGSL